MATDADIPAIPLTRWADDQLGKLASLTGSPEIASLDGATLLGERAMLGGYRIPGDISAGNGSSRLLPTADGRWFALTLSRAADRELLPALFGDAVFDTEDGEAIARAVANAEGETLLRQGRMLGLAVALADEGCDAAPVEILAHGDKVARTTDAGPLVLDLSSVWAGPLAAHLLWLAGARVVKVENPRRPDMMREGDAGLFGLLTQGKANVALDPTTAQGREDLLALVRKADIVIESARPRALAQLGIDADRLVRQQPGLVWINITAHGGRGDAAAWAGFGHDCGVAAGLSAALHQVTGTMGYVGDALPDPLTGIYTARAAWDAWRRGAAQRLAISLSGVTALALADTKQSDGELLRSQLTEWHAACGHPFPEVAQRAVSAPVRPLGADNAEWLPC